MKLNLTRDYNVTMRGWILKNRDRARELAAQPRIERNCPVCDSASWSHFADNGVLDYARCGDCDHVFMNPTFDPKAVAAGFKGADPLVMEYFDLMEAYRREVPGKPDPATDPKMKDIYRFKTSGRLLDVGCAFGDFLHKAKHFYEVEGLEINPRTAAIAAKDFTIHRDFLHNLDLGPSYDVVTLHEVLYGAPDPVGLLRDAGRVLKDDGILYVHTGNSASYATQLFGGKSNHLYGYSMQNVFSPKSLRRIAERCGFSVASLRTEWLDIYLCDLLPFLDGDPGFIHKKNVHIPDYEASMAREEELQVRIRGDLGERGNYLIAVLRKSGDPKGSGR